MMSGSKVYRGQLKASRWWPTAEPRMLASGGVEVGVMPLPAEDTVDDGSGMAPGTIDATANNASWTR